MGLIWKYGSWLGLALILFVLLPVRVFAQAMEYTIQPGETIASIAARHGVSSAAILSLNKIQNPNLIRPGQKILLPGVLPASQPGQPQIYTVQRGDTLYGIARAYRVSPEALLASNRLNTNSNIYVGQQLVIPGVVAPPVPVIVVEQAQPVVVVPPPAPVYVAPTAVPPTAVPPTAAPVVAAYPAGGLSQRINGDAGFVQTMQTAIQWLAANDPAALSVAEAYITVIAPSALPNSALADFRFDGYTKTCNVGMLVAETVPLTASLLYHEALHCKHGFDGVYLPNWQEESYAYTEQIAFLRRHNQANEQIAFYEQVLAQYRNNGVIANP
jgi:LysM repeat protein